MKLFILSTFLALAAAASDVSERHLGPRDWGMGGETGLTITETSGVFTVGFTADDGATAGTLHVDWFPAATVNECEHSNSPNYDNGFTSVTTGLPDGVTGYTEPTVGSGGQTADTFTFSIDPNDIALGDTTAHATNVAGLVTFSACLRVGLYEGTPAAGKLWAFREGWFEVQYEATEMDFTITGFQARAVAPSTFDQQFKFNLLADMCESTTGTPGTIFPGDWVCLAFCPGPESTDPTDDPYMLEPHAITTFAENMLLTDAPTVTNTIAATGGSQEVLLVDKTGTAPYPPLGTLSTTIEVSNRAVWLDGAASDPTLKFAANKCLVIEFLLDDRYFRSDGSRFADGANLPNVPYQMKATGTVNIDAYARRMLSGDRVLQEAEETEDFGISMIIVPGMDDSGSPTATIVSAAVAIAGAAALIL